MLADELIEVHEKPRQVAPFSERYPALTPARGYEAALALTARALAAAELVSTGTLTDAHPVSPGELWGTELNGLPLPGLTIRFK